jgi:hypothetical protein
MFTSQASLSSMLLTHSTTTMLSSTITKYTQQQNLIPQKQNTNEWMYGMMAQFWQTKHSIKIHSVVLKWLFNIISLIKWGIT